MPSKKHAPRYAPRDRYRTRPSTREIAAFGGELDATALDRPVFSPRELATLRARRATPKRAPDPSLLPLAAVVIGTATLAGAIFGAALALI